MKATTTAIDTEQEYNAPEDIYNRAANWELAGLLPDSSYKLTAKQQIMLLGFVVGRGRVLCDWERGLAFNVVTACFGCDTTYANCYDLRTGEKQY